MIRPVHPSDISRICEIYNHYVVNTTVSFETTPLTLAQMKSRVEGIAAEHPYYVWEDEVSGRVIGFCYVHPWKDRPAYAGAMETTIYLAPEATGHGIGRLLMERLIADCRQRGYYSLIACITGGNLPSIRLHEALGFTQVSHFEAVGHKLDLTLDVVDYQLLF
ncbi:MAG: N-acetyltransferase family protein [Bacteroidales bacterium]|nr:N-acetyltransferase family protein [Bacteroidales bacterium]